MTSSFVVVHLDVNESPNKKDLENEGGEALMTGWHGSGLPFMVVLDPAGKVLTDSNLNGNNIGYPAKPEEIAQFMKMLDSAPRMSKAAKEQIRTWLVSHAPK